MKPDTLEVLVCGQDWIRSDAGIKGDEDEDVEGDETVTE
jgi:hypothetical protein